MKRNLALLLALVMCISLVGCGKTMCSVDGCENEAVEDTDFEEALCSKHIEEKKASIAAAEKNAQNEQAIAEIKQAIDALEMETAYNLCVECLMLDITEEQRNKIYSYEQIILDNCYSGTFIVKIDSITEITPSDIGKNSYFEVGILKEYDEVFCRYTYNKHSEKEMVAKQYKEYLDSKYTFLGTTAKNKYIVYEYADEQGNGLGLQVFDENYGSADITILLDADFFDVNIIDMSNDRADLFDPSIWTIGH